MTLFRSILVAADGSERAEKALRHALSLAKPLDAKLTIVTVTNRWPLVEVAAQAEIGVKDPAGFYSALAEKGARAILDRLTAIAKEEGMVSHEIHISGEHPVDGILEAAKQASADLIVMASRGRGRIGQLLLGSVANEVVTHSEVPVLVVR